MVEIGTGRNFPPVNPSFLDKATTYLIINALVLPILTFYSYVLNRTRIHGREHLRGLKAPWIICSNHSTMMDDMFVDPIILWRQFLNSYESIPFHAPEENNFYKNPLMAWFMRSVKCIPLIRGRGANQEGLNRLIDTIRNGGSLHIFPEGTRSRTGQLGPGKIGVAKLAYLSNATVIPVYHRGLETVLPIGTYFPRPFRRVEIMIGEPIDLTEERKMEDTPQTWKLISRKIMAGIAEQRDKAEQIWGKREFQISEKVKAQLAQKQAEEKEPDSNG